MQISGFGSVSTVSSVSLLTSVRPERAIMGDGRIIE
jgi:hypothetical protein